MRNGEVDVAWLIPRKDYGSFADPKFNLFYTYGSPEGSSVAFAARSAAAKRSGRWRSYHGR